MSFRHTSSIIRLVPVLLVLLVLVAPSAAGAATLNRPFDLQATIDVASDPGRARDDVVVVSGALSFEADLRGVLIGSGDVSSTFQVGHIEVYDANDGEAFARGQPALRVDDAVLRPATDASYAWSFPESHATGATAHTVGLIVDIETHLTRVAAFIPERDGGPLPHLVVDGRGGSWSFHSQFGRSVYLPIEGGFSVQAGGASPRVFEGTEWIAFLGRGTDADLEAINLAMPTHKDLTLRFGRADDAVFTERFTSARVNTFVGQALDLARVVQGLGGPPDFAEPDCLDDPLSCLPQPSASAPAQVPPTRATGPDGFVYPPALLRTAQATTTDDSSPEPNRQDAHVAEAPGDSDQESPLGLPNGVLENSGSILNGAVVGNLTGQVFFGDQLRLDPALSVMRFDHLDVGGFESGKASMSGSSPFAYSGGGAYSTTAAVQIAYFIVPVLSMILFAVAALAFLVARARRTDEDEARGRHLRTLSILARVSLLVVALVLFDRELYLVFGESVLATMGFWGGAGFSWGRLGIILLAQALLWSYAALLFGLPVGIIGRSALKFGGFSKRTYGFAWGLAALSAFVLGVGLIRPIIGAVIGTIEGTF